MVPQADSLTQRFYTDPEANIQTPAFDGREGFSTLKDVTSFLEAYAPAAGVPYRVETIGQSQKGQAIPIVYLGSDRPEALRIWIMGGLHGDEPGGWEGIMHFMNRLKEPKHQTWLSQVRLAILPMANPDGCNALTRLSANGLDLNRDQTKLIAPETALWKLAYNAFQPEVALDMHEYRPYRKDYLQMGTQGMAAYYDVCFLFSGNLNVPEELRSYTRTSFVANAERWMDSLGLSHHEYFTTEEVKGRRVIKQGSVHARSSASHHALTNSMSTLVEVRGVGLGRTAFKRRVMASSSVILSYVGHAVEHSEELRAVLSRARRSTHPAVVQSTRPESEQRVTMIDLAKKDTASVRLPIRDSFRSEPKLIRSRAKAYIVRNSSAELRDKLKALGVEWTEAENRYSNAELYRVTALTKDAFDWEGVRPLELETTLEQTSLELIAPEGNSLKNISISMDQKNSNLLIELLEPEAANSFVRLGLIQAVLNEELPIYRILP